MHTRLSGGQSCKPVIPRSCDYCTCPQKATVQQHAGQVVLCGLYSRGLHRCVSHGALMIALCLCQSLWLDGECLDKCCYRFLKSESICEYMSFQKGKSITDRVFCQKLQYQISRIAQTLCSLLRAQKRHL